MKLRTVCVGKPRDELCVALHDRYATRLPALGVRYLAGSVSETRGAGRYSDDHVRQRESRSLIDAVDAGECLVVLDPRGEAWSTELLARRIERGAGRPTAFLIGGPLGHHDLLRERADSIWALSPLTFPHELVRALVAEQLYRAASMLRGHPYHRG